MDTPILLPKQNLTTSTIFASRIPYTESERWLAIKSRARDANSNFLYGVTTTRIYCRPTCLGRVARRANIVYFNDILMAQSSGYRACKRCKPDEKNWSRDSSALETVQLGQTLITQTTLLNKDWTVEDIATQLGVSSPHFHRLFKRIMKMTPKEFARQLANNSKEQALFIRSSPIASYGYISDQPTNTRHMNSGRVDAASSVETSVLGLASTFHISGELFLAADGSLHSCIGLDIAEDSVNWEDRGSLYSCNGFDIAEDSVNWEDWVSLELEDGNHGEG